MYHQFIYPVLATTRRARRAGAAPGPCDGRAGIRARTQMHHTLDRPIFFDPEHKRWPRFRRGRPTTGCQGRRPSNGRSKRRCSRPRSPRASSTTTRRLSTRRSPTPTTMTGCTRCGCSTRRRRSTSSRSWATSERRASGCGGWAARTRPSGPSSARTSRSTLDAGFEIHLSKPIDHVKLVGAVASLVGRDPQIPTDSADSRRRYRSTDSHEFTQIQRPRQHNSGRSQGPLG